MAVNQGIADGKVLGHADHRIVNGRIPMGVEFSHHFAHDPGGLAMGPVGPKTKFAHPIQNPALDGLQPIPDIGQGPLHDDAHRVGEIRLAHLIFQADRYDFAFSHL